MSPAADLLKITWRGDFDIKVSRAHSTLGQLFQLFARAAAVERRRREPRA